LIHRGHCHCGAVAFEVEAPERITALDCSCTICTMTGFVHLIVPKSKFRLLQGEESLVSYRFNTGVADHTFCGTCGIKSFYVPRSNPDGIDVNVRCLDPQPVEVILEPFDGRNWDAHGSELAHLSKEP
jgi:hypothetical protein